LVEQQKYYCGRFGKGHYFPNLLGRLYKRRMTGELILQRDGSPEKIYVEQESVIWTDEEGDGARSRLLDMFNWAEGRYTFWPQAKPPADDSIRGFFIVDLILDGVKQISDTTILLTGIDHSTGLLRPAVEQNLPSSGCTLTATECFLLSRLDGTLSLGEICRISPVDRTETLRGLYGLTCAGLIEFDGAGKRPERIDAERDPGIRPPGPPADTGGKGHSGESENDEREAVLEKHATCCKLKADHYTVLEIPQSATADEIRQAHQRLSLEYHPTRSRRRHLEDLGNQISAVAARIDEAYRVLGDRQARCAHDERLPTEPGVRRAAVTPISVEESPVDLARSHFEKGLEYFDRKDYHSAIQLFRMAVLADEKNGRYHRQLGTALSQNPLWRRRAEHSLRRAVELDPQDAQAHYLLGRLYLDSGLHRRAEASFKKARSIDPLIDTKQEPEPAGPTPAADGNASRYWID